MSIEKKNYLVILPCSKLKNKLDNVPAIDLYNGQFYKLIRKFVIPNLDIIIISAKYGLIKSNTIISYYDQKMSKKRASELSISIKPKLEEVLSEKYYDAIFVNLGKIYEISLKDSEKILKNYNVIRANGQIGERLHQLKHWLLNISSSNR